MHGSRIDSIAGSRVVKQRKNSRQSSWKGKRDKELHVCLVFMCTRVDTCIKNIFLSKFSSYTPPFEKFLDPRLGSVSKGALAEIARIYRTLNIQFPHNYRTDIVLRPFYQTLCNVIAWCPYLMNVVTRNLLWCQKISRKIVDKNHRTTIVLYWLKTVFF